MRIHSLRSSQRRPRRHRHLSRLSGKRVTLVSAAASTSSKSLASISWAMHSGFRREGRRSRQSRSTPNQLLCRSLAAPLSDFHSLQRPFSKIHASFNLKESSHCRSLHLLEVPLSLQPDRQPVQRRDQIVRAMRPPHLPLSEICIAHFVRLLEARHHRARKGATAPAPPDLHVLLQSRHLVKHPKLIVTVKCKGIQCCPSSLALSSRIWQSVIRQIRRRYVPLSVRNQSGRWQMESCSVSKTTNISNLFIGNIVSPSDH